MIGVPAELTGGRRTLPAGYRPDPDLPDDPAPRRHLARLEGPDLRRLDGTTETDRVG